MQRLRHWTPGLLLAAAATGLPACSFDTDQPAPEVAAPNATGLCGTTDTVFPKLLAFVRDDRFSDLRVVIERHLVPSEANLFRPDVSFRTILGALLDLVTRFGLDRTASTAEITASSESFRELEPLVLTTLRFINGDLDGQDRYAAGDAAAHFVRVCDPDHLLLAIESLLRLRSPSNGDRLWLDVLSDQMFELIEDPFFEPFLQTFENDAERGRPAIVSLLAQVMGFMRQDDFDISRVDTLLESAVYPLVNETLRLKIVVLVDLLGEATSDEADIFKPLQRAVSCGMDHPPQRDELLGFAFDLITIDEIGLQGLLDTVKGVVSQDDTELLLGVFADAIGNLRASEPRDRDDLLELLAVLLSQPDSRLVLPTITELIDAGVIIELFDAVATLLEGCGRVTS